MNTNAYRKYYKLNEAIRVQSSTKYIDYISKFSSSSSNSKTGERLLPSYKIAHMYTYSDYIYWDDPNELVERLRLLIAETSAGNENHVNEIQSIIEELREAKFIY